MPVCVVNRDSDGLRDCERGVFSDREAAHLLVEAVKLECSRLECRVAEARVQMVGWTGRTLMSCGEFLGCVVAPTSSSLRPLIDFAINLTSASSYGMMGLACVLTRKFL